MKTVKYQMTIVTENLYGATIDLTKKQFLSLLNRYKSMITEHRKLYPSERDEETGDFVEYYLKDIDVETTEYEKYIDTVYTTIDGVHIYLHKIECKDGYHFNTKKRSKST